MIKKETKYTCCGGPTAVGGHQPNCPVFNGDKLNKLRQAIIKEIPEIVELKFGCEMKIELTERHLYEHIKKVYLGKREGMNYDYFFRNGRSGVVKLALDSEFKIIEIIGRPITLADVLRVLDGREDSVFSVENTEWGGEFIYTTENGDVESSRYWNLSKNDLSLQSEKTIYFLADIILKENE